MENSAAASNESSTASNAMKKWFFINAATLPEGKLDDAKKKCLRATWKSCWVQPPNALFDYKYRLSLEDQKRMNLSNDMQLNERELFLLKPLYFWVPDLFFYQILRGKLPCPTCYKEKKRDYRTLYSIGWNDSGLRHVFGLTSSYYVICKRYKCKVCSKSVVGYSSELLALLPECVSSQFPCVVTPNLALDKSTMKLLRRQAVTRQSFEDFADMVNEANATLFYEQENVYYSSLVHRRSGPMNAFLSRVENVEKFGSILEDFDFRILKGEYLRTLYETDGLQRIQWLHGRMGMIDGKVLSVDHTFKTARKVKFRDELTGNYLQPFSSTLTVYNEYSQVCCQFFSQTKSLRDVTQDLKEIISRYDAYGSEKPSIVYSDNCCNDRNELLSCFGSDVQVKLDAYHFMDRYVEGCRQKHPLFPTFVKKLRDAIFQIYEPDREALQEKMKEQKKKVKFNEEYFVSRCRRTIPKANLLEERLNRLIDCFSQKYYESEDKQKVFLFKSSMTMIHKNAIAHVQKNCVSDSDLIDTYFKKSNGTLGCRRGTSSLEGYHRGINSIFQAPKVSAAIAHIQLAEFNHRWNVDSAIRNRAADQLYFYDHFIIEKTKALAQTLQISLYENYISALPTVECTFGFPSTLLANIKVLLLVQENDDDDDGMHLKVMKKVSNKRVRSEAFITERAKIPHHPKPVETKEEKALFTSLYSKHDGDMKKIEEEFNVAVTEASEDEMKNLRFKTVALLEKYHKSMVAGMQRKEAIHRTENESEDYIAFTARLKASVLPNTFSWNCLPANQLLCPNAPAFSQLFLSQLPLCPLPASSLTLNQLVGNSDSAPVRKSRRKMTCKHCKQRRTLETGHKRGLCPFFSK